MEAENGYLDLGGLRLVRLVFKLLLIVLFLDLNYWRPEDLVTGLVQSEQL